MMKIIIALILMLTVEVQAQAALVSYWSFNEDSGSIAYDPVSSNDGTIYGASWTVGKYGSALNFDGIDDYINVGDVPSLDISSAITIEAWAQTTLITNDTIISKDDDLGNREYYLGLSYGVEVPGKVRWALNTTSFQDIDTLTSANDNEWHHIAATYDGLFLRVYIDGIEDSNSPAAQSGLIPNTNAALRIGAMSDIGYEQFFQGLIDEVRIYDHALTRDEIVRDMNTNSVVPEPASIVLFTGGLWGLGLWRKIRGRVTGPELIKEL